MNDARIELVTTTTEQEDRPDREVLLEAVAHVMYVMEEISGDAHPEPGDDDLVDALYLYAAHIERLAELVDRRFYRRWLRAKCNGPPDRDFDADQVKTSSQEGLTT